MFKKNINNHCKTVKSLQTQEKKINKIINLISKNINSGGKILFCGNGGSAADAQHLAAEFLVRLIPGKNRKPLPALSLATDTSTLTACVNDFKAEDIFLRAFTALHNKNDILFAISTSGKSKNIIKVLKKAKKEKIYSVGLYGMNGGEAKLYTDDSIIVKSKNVSHIQEAHIFLGHYILKNIEKILLKN